MTKENVSQTIYENILNSIENLLHSLSKGSDDEEIESYKCEAITKLNGIKQELIENIKSLEENSEWDKFTIAFYGETNAGKSTLIECLRILLKEKKKVDDHKNFVNKKTELKKLSKQIYDLELDIITTEDTLNQLELENQTHLSSLEHQNQTASSENKKRMLKLIKR